MEKKINKCDNCYKITEDVRKEKDWIQISGSTFVEIKTNGKNPNFPRTRKMYDGGFDFCCGSCILDYIDKMQKER